MADRLSHRKHLIVRQTPALPCARGACVEGWAHIYRCRSGQIKANWTSSIAKGLKIWAWQARSAAATQNGMHANLDLVPQSGCRRAGEFWRQSGSCGRTEGRRTLATSTAR